MRPGLQMCVAMFDNVVDQIRCFLSGGRWLISHDRRGCSHSLSILLIHKYFFDTFLQTVHRKLIETHPDTQTPVDHKRSDIYLVGDYGKLYDRLCVVDRLDHAVETTVCYEEPDFLVSEEVVLRNPIHDFDILNMQTMGCVFQFPYHLVFQLLESLAEASGKGIPVRNQRNFQMTQVWLVRLSSGGTIRGLQTMVSRVLFCRQC